jgi:hypothetical protein
MIDENNIKNTMNTNPNVVTSNDEIPHKNSTDNGRRKM